MDYTQQIYFLNCICGAISIPGDILYKILSESVLEGQAY